MNFTLSAHAEAEILEQIMKANYNHEGDVLTVVFTNTLGQESDEVRPGVTLDYDVAGNVVGLEILDASHRIENPTAMEFFVQAA